MLEKGQYNPSQQFVMSELPPYCNLLLRFRIGKTGSCPGTVPAVVTWRQWAPCIIGG